MLTVGASAVAWYAFTDIDRSVTRITAESIVGMAASLRLAEKSAEITATAPALIASRSEEERAKEQERLVRRLNEISAVTEGLKVTGMAEARFANLIEIEGKIATELKALDGAVAQRLRLSAQRQTAVADLAVVETKFQNALEPLVDDASFNLVTTSEEVTAKSKEAITGLIEGGVNALQALLTLRADGNLAASLLGEAAHVDDPALIQPIRERFSAAAAAIEKSLEALPQSPENGRLREASKTLIALGRGVDNVFEVRSQELRAPAETRHSLQVKREGMTAAVEVAHRTLFETLTPMVDDAGFDLVTTSEDVTAKSTKAITGLVEGGANTLQVLLTLRAEGNLAAGLLNEAAGVPDPEFAQAAPGALRRGREPRGEAARTASRRGRRRCAQGPHGKADRVRHVRRKHLRFATRGATPDRGCSGVLTGQQLARPASRQGGGGTRPDCPEQQRCSGDPHRPGHPQWPAPASPHHCSERGGGNRDRGAVCGAPGCKTH